MTWAPDYADVDELRTYLRIPAWVAVDPAEDPDDAAVFAPALAAASRAVDRSCGRQFGSSDDGMAPPAVTFTYTLTWDAGSRLYFAVIDDVLDTDDLVVEVAGTVTTAYRLEPGNFIAQGKPAQMMVIESGGTSEASGLAVTAHFGWPTVPDTVKLATLLQASRFVKRREAPFGIAGSPEMGNELRLQAKVDPDVEVMLGAYRRYV